jgi:predicted amidohydrolase YtcJ
MSSLTGSLQPGKRFDAVIWDDNLMTVPEGEMLEVRVKATILDGRIVHGALEM